MGKAKTKADTRIRLFEARDDNHPRNATYEGIERFNGLEKERKKTDASFIGCLVIPHIFVLAFCYFMWITSDFNRLDHAADFRGDLCGKKGTTVENIPYAYYFDPIGVPDIAMCVASCPSVDGQEICFYDVDGITVMDDYCYQTIASRAVNQYCIPMVMGQNRTLVESFAHKDVEFYKRIASSLFWGVDLTSISLVSMFLLGLLYNTLIVHNKSRNQMFKFTLLMIFFFAGGFIYGVKLDIDWHLQKQCLNPGVDDGCGGQRVQFDYFLIYFIVFVTLVFYLYLFLQRKNIRLLLGNIRVLLRPLRQLKKTYLLIALVFTVEIIIIQVFIFLYIITTTTGKLKIVAAPALFPNPTYAAIIHDDIYSNFIYVAIGLLIWWLGVMQQFTRMLVCGIASNWYFAKEKTILDDPIISGFKYTMKYHLGSVILSSILTFLLWPYNVLLQYARMKIPKLNKKSRKFRFWMNSCTPFLIFYEEWTKFVSHKNLYQVMVFGEEYYNSGVRSFYLRFRNVKRLENIQKIIGYFTLIGKFFCTLGGATLLNLYMHYRYKNAWQKEMDNLEYPIAPSVVILFVGFFATQTISSVMDITAESLQYCFVCDEEMYAGKQRFVDDEMIQLMNMHGEEAKNANDLEIHARPKVNDEVFQEYDAPNINIPEAEPEDDHHDHDNEDEEEEKKDTKKKKVETPPEFANNDADEIDDNASKKDPKRTTADNFQDLAMDDLFSKPDPSQAKGKGIEDQDKPFKINIPTFKSNDESSLFHGGAISEDTERVEPKKIPITKGFNEISGLDILGATSRDNSAIEDSRAGDLNKKLFNSSKLKIEEVGSESEDEEDVDINKKDLVKGRDGFVF